MGRRSDNGRDGLLIDTWHWKYQGVEEDSLAPNLRGVDDDPVDGAGTVAKLVKEQVVPIEVRMLKSFDESHGLPRGVKDVEFVLVCKLLELRLQGSDIEALRQAMWSRLESHFHIKWEAWYLVQIAPARSHMGDLETGFALSQNTIYRGVARDGTVLMREYDRNRTFSPWRYKPWPGEYQKKGGHVVACIPATKENDRALDEFRSRIRELQNRLSDLVKPQVILQTLANLSQIGLPAPATSNADDD